MSERWHPWKHAGENYPQVLISCGHELPPRVWGLQRGNRIWLCSRLNQVRRRCTLTHEIVHLERGGVVGAGRARRREERVVDEIAARRLIPLDALTDALRWTQRLPELAEELWVDQPTIRTRMNTLDPVEVAELEHHLEDQWLWIP